VGAHNVAAGVIPSLLAEILVLTIPMGLDRAKPKSSPMLFNEDVAINMRIVITIFIWYENEFFYKKIALFIVLEAVNKLAL
jgi:hypothetical protein